MKKTLLIIALFVLLAPLAGVQGKAFAADSGSTQLMSYEGRVAAGYRWDISKGNPMADEYEYQHSSAAGSARIEYDPLPQRFLLESVVNNTKDYYAEFDYAYKDIFTLNLLARSLYHNLDHYSLGTDNLATPVPYSTDLSPDDIYGVQDAMNRAIFRFKTPDFPFHVYLEARNQIKRGTIQQVFLSSFSGGYNRLSRSRDINWETTEVKATVNSHLDWVEVEYSHAEKQFKATSGKVMNDAVPGTSLSYDHNLAPDLESSTDTVKIHTSHTGRIAAAGTYASGDRKNKDSDVKSTFTNAAGDLTIIPWKELTISVKYRHFEVNEDNPATVISIDSLGVPTAYAVRKSLNPKKDLMSGYARYRATDNLTVRAEYIYENLSRDIRQGDPAGSWQLDDKVTRGTVRLGATYRVWKRLMVRGDVSRQAATVPADSVDNTYPKTSDTARATLTWTPAAWFSALLSGGMVRETRNDLNPPFADERTAERNQVLGSFTFVLGQKASLTPSYAYFQNKQTSPIAYTGDLGSITAETGVPYADTSHVASLALSYVLTDEMMFTAEAARCWSRGSWENSGVVPGSSGIAGLTSIKTVETTGTADLAVGYARGLGTEFRYQIRKLDDLIDDGQDGVNQIALATLTYKW